MTYERTDDTPWAAVPLLDESKPTLWLRNDYDETAARLVRAGYTIQYRPRKRRVTKKIKTSDRE